MRLYSFVAVCLLMTSPSLAAVQSHAVGLIHCPEAVLHALVTDAGLDLTTARNELVPGLRKIVLDGAQWEEPAWGRLPVNGTRSGANQISAMKERIVTRLNGIEHDLGNPRVAALVMPLRGPQAQKEALAQLCSTHPSNAPIVTSPPWVVRGRHWCNGCTASLTCLLATTVGLSWNWPAQIAVAAGVGGIWVLAQSLYENEVEQQRVYRHPISHPEDSSFFMGLKQHEELIAHPQLERDWVYSSINFELQSQPFYVDIMTHVVAGPQQTTPVTWLILRRP